MKYSRANIEKAINKETGNYNHQIVTITDEESLHILEMSTENFTPARARKLWKQDGNTTDAELFELVITEDDDFAPTDIYFE